MLRIAPALLVMTMLAACRLVDQRTFEGTGVFPASAQLARADYAQRALPPPPLLTIRFGVPDPGWQQTLIEASRAARERKADVIFDVVTPIPTMKPLPVQDEAQRTGAQDAAKVAAALEGDDVSPSQIRLGSRGDAGNPPREVEVYVR